VLNVLKSGSLNLLETYGPFQACNGIALLLPVREHFTQQAPGHNNTYGEYDMDWKNEDSQFDFREREERHLTVLKKNRTGFGAHSAS
jgi:hypothetical protein